MSDDPFGVLAGQQHGVPVYPVRVAGRRLLVAGTGIRDFFAQERTSLAVLNTALVHDLFGDALFNLQPKSHPLARRALHGPLRRQFGQLPAELTACAEAWSALWPDGGCPDLHAAARELTWAMSATALIGVGTDEREEAAVRTAFEAFAAATCAPSGPARRLSPRYRAGMAARAQLLSHFAAHVEGPGLLPDLNRTFADPRPVPLGSAGEHLLAMLIAARDTTASLITWLIVEMASHPDAAAACHSEAAAAVADPQLLARRNQIPALFGALLETERLHAPNLLSQRRALRSLTLAGAPVPVGARIAYTPSSGHFEPARYPEPHTFAPERFTDSAAGAGLMTFGAGAHACPGRPLAELMALSAAAALLRRGRPRLPSGMPVRIRYLPAKAPERPLPIVLEPWEGQR